MEFPQKQIFYFLAFGLASISLLLTETRAAYFATFVGLVFASFVWLLYHTEKNRRIKIILVGGIFGAVSFLMIALLAIFQEHIPYIQEIRSTRIGGLLSARVWAARTMSWQAAYDSIVSSPIIGYGLGSSYNLFFLFRKPDARLFWTEHSYNHVHSELLEFTQEGGLLGLVLLIGFWITIGVMLFKVFRTTDKDIKRRLAIGIGSGLIAYGVHSLFSVAPRMMVTRLPVFTLVGLAFVLHLQRSDEDNKSRIQLKNFLLVTIPLISLVIMSWYLYLPWIKRQNETVIFQSSRQSLLKIEKFEKNRKNGIRRTSMGYIISQGPKINTEGGKSLITR